MVWIPGSNRVVNVTECQKQLYSLLPNVKAEPFQLLSFYTTNFQFFVVIRTRKHGMEKRNHGNYALSQGLELASRKSGQAQKAGDW